MFDDAKINARKVLVKKQVVAFWGAFAKAGMTMKAGACAINGSSGRGRWPQAQPRPQSPPCGWPRSRC